MDEKLKRQDDHYPQLVTCRLPSGHWFACPICHAHVTKGDLYANVQEGGSVLKLCYDCFEERRAKVIPDLEK